MLKRFILIVSVIALAIVAFALVKHMRSRNAESGETPNPNSASHKLWHCGMHPQVIQDHPGDCPICHMALTPMGNRSSAASADRKPLYWWDPMLGTPSISDRPGKSAMGMDLVPVYAESAGPDMKIDPIVVQNMGVRTA